jgi:hypothetical protein
VIKYHKVYKYILDEDVTARTLVTGYGVNIASGDDGEPWISLTQDGALLIRDEYSWDGPSGPAVDTKTFMRASLVHDALYQLVSEELLPRKCRKLADKTMRKLAKEDGMGLIRRTYTYWAVRIFGAFAV